MGAITAGQIITTETCPRTDGLVGDTWEDKIKNLMRDFGFEKESNSVILSVKGTATSTELENEDLMYDRAWRKFKTLLFSDRRYN